MPLTTPPIALALTEIADQSLAAGASITPTIDGEFIAALDATFLQAEIYFDITAAWVTTGATTKFIESILGQANKIRFKNTDSVTRNIVVIRRG